MVSINCCFDEWRPYQKQNTKENSKMEKLDCLKIHAVVFSLPSFFSQKWNIWKIVFLSQLSVSSCCCCFFVFPRIGHFSLKIAIFWGRGFEPGPLTLASASWSRKQNSTTEQGPKGSIRSLRYWVTQLHCGKESSHSDYLVMVSRGYAAKVEFCLQDRRLVQFSNFTRQTFF